MTRIFFDISDTIAYIRHHHSISGIQRATVMSISEVVRQQPEGTVYLSFVRPHGTKAMCCPASEVLTQLEKFDTHALRRTFGIKFKGSGAEVPFLERYRGKPLKRLFHVARLRAALLLKDRAFLERKGIAHEDWVTARNGLPRGKGRQRALFDVAQPGDIICSLGATWGMKNVTRTLRSAHAEGIRVFVLVHDLIPLKFPETTDFQVPSKYQEWLFGTLQYCTGFLANSRSTARDLEGFLRDAKSDKPVHVTPLAQAPVAKNVSIQGRGSSQDISHHQDGEKFVPLPQMSGAVREATLLPYVLCVGTIEPRKNLWRLVQAWKQLVQEVGRDVPRLVLAGKRGWLSDEFLRMLDRTGGLGGWVSFVEKPSDIELDYLYRHCRFTATVSLYEGWGLPIGEGLSYGKTGIVSETSSMPEVGGNMVEYCNPNSVESIASAARRLICDPAHVAELEERIKSTTLRTWQDVGQDILSALQSHSDNEAPAMSYPSQARVGQ